MRYLRRGLLDLRNADDFLWLLRWLKGEKHCEPAIHRELTRTTSIRNDPQEDRSPERWRSIPDSTPEDVSRSRTPSARDRAENYSVGPPLAAHPLWDAHSSNRGGPVSPRYDLDTLIDGAIDEFADEREREWAEDDSTRSVRDLIDALAQWLLATSDDLVLSGAGQPHDIDWPFALTLAQGKGDLR